MIQDLGTHRFHNEYCETAADGESRVICCRGREIFVNCKEDRISFLTYAQVIRCFPELAGKETYLFSIDEVTYFLFRGQPGEFLSERADDVFQGFSWEKPEHMRTALPREMAFAGVTGMQLSSWYKSRRYCPCCGSVLEHSTKERMLYCPNCGQVEYPKICPAVIVGVIHKDKILLTKYAGRAYTKYALIAGFTEIGESIEDTVRREVMEEVGLRVKNIRYYKSQPWSFSDTLLMGFFCEVDGDDTIRLDETELSVAEWHVAQEVPEDDGVSLTREMMRVFREKMIFR